MTSTSLHEDAGTAPATSTSRGGLRGVLALRDVRLLVAGTTTSLLGDQFALIAIPWLVLQLGGDPLVLGAVLALEGVPRAAVMLVGGAVTDRCSPRRVMLVTDLLRGALAASLAAVVLVGAAEVWMLCCFALGFGVLAGFAVPAHNSMIPTLVGRDHLQAGNAVLMSATQLTAFVGPTLAGIVIAGRSSSTIGVGFALGIDAATFAVSAATFALMRPPRLATPPDGPPQLWSSIREGLVELWNDEAMRFVFCLLAAVNLFAVGPLLVGIPVLAHERLAEGAFAFGVLMAAFAVGNLVGYLLAGSAARPSSDALRVVIVAVLAAHGAVIASLGLVAHLGIGSVLLAGLGVGNGYLAISLFTWIQSRTPPRMLGRTMSVFTFSSLGLVSVSQAVAGAVGGWNLDALFLLSGGLVLVVTARSAAHRGLRVLADSLTASPTPAPEEGP